MEKHVTNVIMTMANHISVVLCMVTFFTMSME